LPVGYGEAHLLTIPSSNGPIHILIDAGPGEGDLTLQKQLQARDIKTLNTVWISHPHPNHVDGLRMLAPGIRAQRLIWSGFEGQEASADVFPALAGQSAWRVHERQAPFRLQIGTVEFIQIHPGARSRSLHRDNLVLLVRHGQVAVLFTGDLSADFQSGVRESVQQELQRRRARLWAITWPHHGDRLSMDWQQWLKQVPFLLLSVGTNEYNLPLPDNILLSSPSLRRTDQAGVIRFESNGKQLEEKK